MSSPVIDVSDKTITRAQILRRQGRSMQEIADALGLTRLDVFRMLQRS